MRRLAIALLAATGGLVMAGSASAADGCGRGWYWNGFECAPRQAYAPRYYGGPPYGGQPYGGPHYYQRYAAPPYQGPGPPEHRPLRGRDGRPVCAHPRYTIQDGICKPYRGY
jgi:hypothetical protein